MTSSYQSVNPNTGKLLKSFEHLSAAQLEKSLAAADNCFQTWKHKSYAERAVIVNKVLPGRVHAIPIGHVAAAHPQQIGSLSAPTHRPAGQRRARSADQAARFATH
ncbi:MAG: aldehyde dehydrogenase family protein [Rhodoferax sp.]